MKPWDFWEPFGKEDLAVKALHSPAETESKVCFFFLQHEKNEQFILY